MGVIRSRSTSRRRRVIDVSGGRIPVVIGVTGMSTAHSIFLAERAEDTGADAVIAMPPHSRTPSRDEVIKFFEELSGEIRKSSKVELSWI